MDLTCILAEFVGKGEFVDKDAFVGKGVFLMEKGVVEVNGEVAVVGDIFGETVILIVLVGVIALLFGLAVSVREREYASS